jgi:hypothetical protein
MRPKIRMIFSHFRLELAIKQLVKELSDLTHPVFIIGVVIHHPFPRKEDPSISDAN